MPDKNNHLNMDLQTIKMHRILFYCLIVWVCCTSILVLIRILLSLKVEFIEEYIKEQKESQRGPLPGPPPPPQDLLGQSPRSVRQNGGSKAVLVARGATCKVSVYELCFYLCSMQSLRRFDVVFYSFRHMQSFYRLPGREEKRGSL